MQIHSLSDFAQVKSRYIEKINKEFEGKGPLKGF